MNEQTLVAFGNYLLSDERKQRFIDCTEGGMPPLEDRLSRVHNEDLKNFFDLHPEHGAF